MAPCAKCRNHVERPDLAAALGRERKAVAEVQDVHAARLLQLSATSPARAVEVHPAPDLEVHQCQQRVGAVDAVGLVVGEQALDASGLEQSALATHSGASRRSRRRQLALEPRAHRRAEAALASIEDVCR
jgi:hypothetical protein